MEHEQSSQESTGGSRRWQDSLSVVQEGLFTTGESIMGLQVHAENGSVEAVALEMSENVRTLLRAHCPYAVCDDRLYPNRRADATDAQWYLRAVLETGRLRQPEIFAKLFNDYCHWWKQQRQPVSALISEQDWTEHEFEMHRIIRRVGGIHGWSEKNNESRDTFEDLTTAITGHCAELFCRRLVEQMLRQMNVSPDDIRVLRKDDPLFHSKSMALGPRCKLFPTGDNALILREKSKEGYETCAEWDLGVLLGASGVLLIDVTTSWDAAKEKIDRLKDIALMRQTMMRGASKDGNMRYPVGIVVHFRNDPPVPGCWRLQSNRGALPEQILQFPLRGHVAHVREETIRRFPYLATKDVSLMKQIASRVDIKQGLAGMTDAPATQLASPAQA